MILPVTRITSWLYCIEILYRGRVAVQNDLQRATKTDWLIYSRPVTHKKEIFYKTAVHIMFVCMLKTKSTIILFLRFYKTQNDPTFLGDQAALCVLHAYICSLTIDGKNCVLSAEVCIFLMFNGIFPINLTVTLHI